MLKEYEWRGSTYQWREGEQPADAKPVERPAAKAKPAPANKAKPVPAPKAVE